MCTDPQLVRLTNDNDIDTLTKRLEPALTGSNRTVLVDTEGPFAVQRNNCQSERPETTECVGGFCRTAGTL